MIQLIKQWLFPQPDWKKPIELQYTDPAYKSHKGNILTVVTYDQNMREYYHAINESKPYLWYNYPTLTPIKDEANSNELTRYYFLSTQGKKYRWGWVKSLKANL